MTQSPFPKISLMKSLTTMTSDDLGTQENLLEVPGVSVYTHRAIVA